ncbi:MAG: AbrB/MazE/SpoVT family DNA-binding domain-containing protein [Candidatus Sigynarchaeum springense]
MIKDYTTKINGKGMITIPAPIRKKHNLTPGREIAVMEIEGVITIIPIMTEKELLESRVTPIAEMEKIYDDARKEELELEK